MSSVRATPAGLLGALPRNVPSALCRFISVLEVVPFCYPQCPGGLSSWMCREKTCADHRTGRWVLITQRPDGEQRVKVCCRHFMLNIKIQQSQLFQSALGPGTTWKYGCALRTFCSLEERNKHKDHIRDELWTTPRVQKQKKIKQGAFKVLEEEVDRKQWCGSCSPTVVVLVNSPGSVPAEVSLYVLCGSEVVWFWSNCRRSCGGSGGPLEAWSFVVWLRWEMWFARRRWRKQETDHRWWRLEETCRMDGAAGGYLRPYLYDPHIITGC